MAHKTACILLLHVACSKQLAGIVFEGPHVTVVGGVVYSCLDVANTNAHAPRYLNYRSKDTKLKLVSVVLPIGSSLPSNPPKDEEIPYSWY